MTNPTSFRFSDMTSQQLDWLVARTGLTRTEVVSHALDRMYQQEQAMKELTAITLAQTEDEAIAATDRAIAAIQQLPEEQQNEIARQEFLRFKKFIDERLDN